GMSWRESAAVGVLMNTRGLVELVILNIGLDLGILSPTLFSVMVLMAVVTTLMTTPLLNWIHPEAFPRPAR
ncbi:MAG TPA: cation:proton antiporter, partial [Nitrospira sp.]